MAMRNALLHDLHKFGKQKIAECSFSVHT